MCNLRAGDIVPGMERLRDLAVTPNNHIWAITLSGNIWANGDIQKKDVEDKQRDEETRAKQIKAPKIKAKQTTVQPVIPPLAFVDTPKAKSIGSSQKEIGGSSTQDKASGAPETLTTKGKITFVNTQKKSIPSRYRRRWERLCSGCRGKCFALGKCQKDI